MEASHKIYIKRQKQIVIDDQTLNDSIEEWVGYWRANIHRFISDYLGLRYFAEFQPVLIYYIDRQPQFVMACSRGLAKSTISLLYCIARCILYPETKIIVVAPLRSQSLSFVQKIKEFMRISPNLCKEIEEDGVKTGVNDCSVTFCNGSKIITKTFAEGARGERGTILVVDEFAQIKDKELLVGVFVPMLTSPRTPPYKDLSYEERRKYIEPTRQVYLSSIRSEMEWSWDYLTDYIKYMTDGNDSYGAIILPYQVGVKGGYILKSNVEQVFRESPEKYELLKAEYEAIPIRSGGGSFFKYDQMSQCRDHTSVLVAKSNEQYIKYKDCPEKWEFYVPKQPNEIRILSMDVALIASAKNDNTSFWLTRSIPNEGEYFKSIAFSESMHGVNTVSQALRTKQLFYEMECDYFAIDAVGSGRGVADVLMQETYDPLRDILYPAWTTANPEDIKTATRSLSNNAVPVMYAMNTSPLDKHNRFILVRDAFENRRLHLPITDLEAIEYYNKKISYFKIDDIDFKSRILNTYAQTNMLLYEANDLETVVSGGLYNLKEKPSKRKDRVMSLCYNLDILNQKEKEYIQQNTSPDISICDYIMCV